MRGRVVSVRIKRLPHLGDLELPAYSTTESTGMDLRAAVVGELTLQPGERSVVPCGFSLELPPGLEGQVRPRSGLALEWGVTVLNAPGTIDSDYRGEVQVILINLGNSPFPLKRGMRIAQLIIACCTRVNWSEVEELSDTERGTRGYGHTGLE